MIYNNSMQEASSVIFPPQKAMFKSTQSTPNRALQPSTSETWQVSKSRSPESDEILIYLLEVPKMVAIII